MKEQKKVPFEYIEEAREEAGFFVRDVCEYLSITERSYYRWKASGKGPRWVYRSLEILSGRLDFQGWKGWRLFDGVLYNEGLNTKYYNWIPADLLVSVFCRCPGHAEAMKRRFPDPKDKGDGRFNVAAYSGPDGAGAPAFHLPVRVGQKRKEKSS